jgi:hypothetical protein
MKVFLTGAVHRQGRAKRCSLPTLLLVSILTLSACGGGSGGEEHAATSAPPTSSDPSPAPMPTSPTPTSPTQQATAKLVVEPTLTAAVTSVSSALTTVSSGELLPVAAKTPAVAIAHNADDAVVALASAEAGSATLELSAVETARTLVWMQMGGPGIKAPMKEVKARIDQSAQFPALVDAVRTASNTADGLMQPAVLELSSAIILELRQPAGTSKTAASLAAGRVFTPRPDFLPKRLFGPPLAGVMAKRPEYDTSNLAIVNSGGLQWRAQSTPKLAGSPPPAYSEVVPAATGLDSLFLSTAEESIELGLSPGNQTVRVFQDVTTKKANLNAIFLSALQFGLGYIPDVGIGELKSECLMAAVSGASGIDFEALAKLSPVQQTYEKLVTTVKGMLSPTSFTSVLTCAGVKYDFKLLNPRFFRGLGNTLLGPGVQAAMKAADATSILGRLLMLYTNWDETKGAKQDVCVANGSVIAETCDINGTLDVDVTLVAKVIPDTTTVTVIRNGVPSQIGIFCGFDEEPVGRQQIDVIALSVPKLITSRWLDAEAPPAGTYDYRTGDFSIVVDIPKEIVSQNNYLTFYDEGRAVISGRIDLRTGLVKGTYEDTEIVSWSYDGTRKVCKANYTFEGALQTP